ncbi:MAG: uridine monophosphate kinase [Chlamydiales bacterium]|nr:uridine monophosphate kinase [Chlamydiales bacterium]
MGELSSGIEAEALASAAKKIADLSRSGVEVAVVNGGGNFFRGIAGSSAFQLERSPADQVGMLATMMNGLLLQQALTAQGVEAHVMSALECPQVAERFHWERARAHLSKGRILILVGGTGHPYFTTDTAAALRASEIGADIFLKATTRVDAIYDKDPLKESDAKPFKTIAYEDFLAQKLGILDLTAVTLCMTNRIPIRVFNFYKGSLLDDSLGTTIR